MPKNKRINELVRKLPGGNELLDNIEAWHGRVSHLKHEGNTGYHLAQEALNDLIEIADAMRSELEKTYKRENGKWVKI